MSENKTELVLTGTLVVQRGDRLFLTAGKAKDVLIHKAVDEFDPVSKRGYQRTGVNSRMRDASRYYEDGGRMPNPILCNIREEDMGYVKVELQPHEQNEYRIAMADKGNWIGLATITIPADVTCWVYDGQHRIGGLEELLKRNAKLEGFPVPLSITLGLAVTQEMEEFFQVNTNAKSVKTDLAWELLRRRAESDPAVALKLDLVGKDWIAKGLEVVSCLEELEGPWYGRIQSPNERKMKSDGLTVGQAQFVQTLRPVLEMPLFQKADAKTIALVVNAFWKGVAIVLPEPFGEDSNPKEWVIQKGPGASVMHRILPRVIEVVRARNLRLGEPESFAEVLEGLASIKGDSVNADGTTTTVYGVNFWKSGADGIAGKYAGESGRKHLFLMVQALLPHPTGEIEL